MSTFSIFDSPPLTQNPEPDAEPVQETLPAPTLPALTEEEVKRALPAHLRTAVTQSLVDTLNNISVDPVAAENIRNNFISYTAVLKEGKFKTEDYLHAVAYVSYKLMGHSNEEAYARAFPNRYRVLIAKGASKKDISSYVAAYHRGKLVNMIMEQALVPTWVLNQDLFQKALNVQAELMMNADSEKVRMEAANSILTHLKKPETKADFQINLNTAESSGMKEMRDLLSQLADQQRQMIEGGSMKTIEVASSRLITSEEGEVEDVG